MDEQGIWEMADGFLSQHPSFSPLSRRQRQLLLVHLHIHRLRAGEVLLKPGQSSKHCWLVLKGSLLCLSPDQMFAGEKLSTALVRCPSQGKGRYFHQGDFVGVEQLIEQQTWSSFLATPEQDTLLLAFSPSLLKLLFQKSPALLRRIRPQVDADGVLLAGLPPPLWQYCQQQKHGGNLSYETMSLHTYRSWQPTLIMLATLFIVLPFIPPRWAFQLRYPLLVACTLLVMIALKLRYSCQLIISEQSLIVSEAKLLSLHYRTRSYPLALLQHLEIDNTLLCPFLPIMGSVSFTFAGEKKRLKRLPAPHRIYNTITVLQQQHKHYPNPELVPARQTRSSSPTTIRTSRRLLGFLTLLLFAFLGAPLSLPPFLALPPPWKVAYYVLIVILFVITITRYQRFYWQFSTKGLFCYDSFDKTAPPWKLIRLEEIEAIQVEQGWLGKMMGFGTVLVHCPKRTEQIRHIPRPFHLLEQCSLLRYAQEEARQT